MATFDFYRLSQLVLVSSGFVLVGATTGGVLWNRWKAPAQKCRDRAVVALGATVLFYLLLWACGQVGLMNVLLLGSEWCLNAAAWVLATVRTAVVGSNYETFTMRRLPGGTTFALITYNALLSVALLRVLRSGNRTKMVSEPGSSYSNKVYTESESNKNSITTGIHMAGTKSLNQITEELIPSMNQELWRLQITSNQTMIENLINTNERTERRADELWKKLSTQIEENKLLRLALQGKEEWNELSCHAAMMTRCIQKNSSKNSYSCREDNEVESDVESLDSMYQVNFLETTEQENRTDIDGKEAANNDQDALTQEELLRWCGKSGKELEAELKRRAKLQRENRKPAEFLTEEEKAIAATSLKELDIKWRLADGRKIKEHDKEEIGILQDNELVLPRKCVRQIILGRRKQAYIDSLKKKGKKPEVCVVCNRVYDASRPHDCFVLRRAPGGRKNGFPAQKEMVVSRTTGGNLHMFQRTVVDNQKVDDNFKKMKQYQIVNEASRPNKPKTIEDIDPTVVIDVSQNDHDEPMAAKDFENNKRIRNSTRNENFRNQGSS